ncbi:hypothetical protein D9613_000619 [Agrocybe pediades]|uniref:Double-strand-break repair protein rad21 n=1 Tax=Agrocybe pediades TaxID=84607 RepID=A0A8H4VRY8_9AGAR|nr:hypothetical protein D9613_000619 [Agrocybe pediades]
MFYSDTILSRRGPLGRVWLAAHMERKLSKSQTLQTDIEQSVDAIMGQEIELMALRLSGQLLLGVAFRPGIVDLTEEQLTVNKQTITLQANGLGLDLLLPDVDWDMDFEDRPLQRHGHHQAHVEDITLRAADDFQFGADDPFAVGPSDGIGSQDFNDFDLGIHWGDEQIDKSVALSAEGSVGVGRDAQFREHSIDMDMLSNHNFNMDMDVLSTRSKSRDPSEQPFGHSMEIDAFHDVDLGDLGIGFDDPVPPLDPSGMDASERRSLSRASSPLTEPPPTPPAGNGLPLPVDQEEVQNFDVVKQKRKPKDRKQIIDSVTELSSNNAAANNRSRAGAHSNPLNTDIASITSTYNFLPRSSVVLRLQEIRNDPVAYFLSAQAKPNGAFLSCAPPGLTPELAQLFARPLSAAATPKRKGTPLEDNPLNKKARRDEEVEVPRRVPSLGPGDDTLEMPISPKDIDASFEFADQPATMDFDVDFPEVGQDMDQDRAKSVVSERSRFSSLAPDGAEESQMVDSTCAIAMFGTKHPQQSQVTEADAEQVDAQETDKSGYSKNTIKALSLIRNELQPTGGEDDPPKSMSFQEMSHKASRRAAASFFFELLVLGTRDCIKVSQDAPFADIKVQPKPRLWEQQVHSQETL